MKFYAKKLTAAVFLLLCLLLLPSAAGAAEKKQVMTLTAWTSTSKISVPVYAVENSWYGCDFELEQPQLDLLLKKCTTAVSVSVNVLDKELIVPDSLEYKKKLKLEKYAGGSGYSSNLQSTLSFQYRYDGQTRSRSLYYYINAHVLNLSVDNLYLTVGKKGFHPSAGNYLPIQVNISVDAFNTLNSYYGQSGKCYLRVQILNSKGKYVYRKKCEVNSSGYWRLHWDGKATKKNSAGVKAGSYVPNGTYRAEAYLYYKGAGESYASFVKASRVRKTFSVSAKAPAGEKGLGAGTELPVYTGNSTIDYLAECMLQEAGVKSGDSADTKVRKIYHYMTVNFKHVHRDQQAPRAHFDLSKKKTKKELKSFTTKTQKQYKKQKILYSYSTPSNEYWYLPLLQSNMLTRSGVCNDHADIFALLCKHAGVYAGVCTGYYLNLNGTKAAHAWNYAVVSGKTWYYDVDVEIQNRGKGQGDYYWYKKDRAQANRTHQFVTIY